MASAYITSAPSSTATGLRFTLETDMPPPPPPVPRSAVDKGKGKELDKWREDEDDEWGAPARAEKHEGEKQTDEVDEQARKKRALERSKRAMVSETWDDDFDFQHAPPPPRTPRSHRTSHSHSRSRPSSPTPRNVSTSSAYSSSIPPSTPSRSSRGRPSSSPPHSPGPFRLPTGIGNPSLDSLASSTHAPSDQEPTLTLDHSSTPRQFQLPPSQATYRKHRPTASASTTRPYPAPQSQQSTPRSRIPRTAHYAPSSPSSVGYSPPTDDELRSTTPSLTEDSLFSLTTGDEVLTDAEAATEDEATEVALAPPLSYPSQDDLNSSGGSLFAGLRKTGSKKWRFGRRGSKSEKSSALPGRRTGPSEPEVMLIHRDELPQDAAQSRLPRPAPSPQKGEQVVILGRRSRTSAGTSGASGSTSPSGIPVRTKHSSNTSVSTSASSAGAGADSRQKRASFSFLPFSFNPDKRRTSTASSLAPESPSTTAQQSWREYEGTTSEDGGETTGADLSEFSGDDGGPSRAMRLRGRGQRGRSAGHRRGQSSHGGGGGTITPSTSFMTSPSTRPVSPVESILGVDKARWNASQVSFASTASAFALRPGGKDGDGGETLQGRKKRLTKKRPEPLEGGSSTVKASGPRSAGLASSLSPSSLSLSSGYTSTSTQNASKSTPQRTRQHRHRQQPSMPFAQDSDDEAAGQRRLPRTRSVTAPVQQQADRKTAAGTEKGDVFQLSDDKEWLGVVPFPPSPRTSLDASGSNAQLSSTPSRSSLRSPSRLLRKVSGQDRSHPPVTARTQAEAKASKRGSGLASSLSNILSRSTSALPLGGKRAPSPAPSAKSVKSSKSMLVRRPSEKKKDKAPEEDVKNLPKSPSLGLLRKRSAGGVSSKAGSNSSSPSVSTPSSQLPSPTERPPLPQSESAFSFFRPRGNSRSTPHPPPPPSPRKRSSIPQPAAAPADSTPRPQAARGRASMARSRPSTDPNAQQQAHSSSAPRGQLNRSFQMPRPHSTVSNVSTSSGSNFSSSQQSTASGSTYASTLMPLGGYRDAAVVKAVRSQQGPPISGFNAARARAPPFAHRPSASLSSIMPLRASSPRPPPSSIASSTSPPNASDYDGNSSPPADSDLARPRTALGGEPPGPSFFFDEDLAVSEADFQLPRRNSLSDLRIPARITSSQKKIEEDLDRVKQFAKGIEDLKALHRQYDQLIKVFVEPPSTDDLLAPPSADRPSSMALHKTAQAARRVEIDYSQWWEQAQTLIDLGDGKPRKEGPRESPAAQASKRDRCVSLAPETTPVKRGAPSGSETETEATVAAAAAGEGEGGSVRPGLLRRVTNPRRFISRQTSASSLETELSVEARQKEMLRGVLAPAAKGASLPSRGVPPPRPGLSVLTASTRADSSAPGSPVASRTSSAEATPRPRRHPLGTSQTVSPTMLRQRKPSLLNSGPTGAMSTSQAARRVSRVGVFGIREFLFRLRSKATEELAASVGAVPDSSTLAALDTGSLTPGRRSVSDPTSRPHTPSTPHAPSRPSSNLNPAALAMRRSSTASNGSSSSGSDWDADLSLASASTPPRSSLVDSTAGSLARRPGLGAGGGTRGRAHSAMSVSTLGFGSGGGAGGRAGGATRGDELFVLTTEAMPGLLKKVREVKERCEACIGLLKGLTV
ncbi:hypothetical protein JCM10207_005208 [Rhodosporidiobolus poonsookiae]